jgi:PAS domain S-box-containing protein
MKNLLLKQNFIYGLAAGILLTAFFLVLKLELAQRTNFSGPYSLLLMAVVAASVIGGYRSALVTLILGVFGAHYLLGAPTPGLFFPQTQQSSAGFTTYVFQSLFVIWVLHLVTVKEKALKTAEDEKATATRIAHSRLQDIETSEGRFRTLFDSNIIGVMFWKLDGQIIEANKAFLDIVGYSENFLLNGKLNYLAITPKRFIEEDKAVGQILRNHSDSYTFEREFIRKDGSLAKVMMTSTLLDKSNPEMGGMTFVMDETNLKKPTVKSS